MAEVTLDTQPMTDREGFHAACERVSGGAAGDGRTMNAFIDCLGDQGSNDGLTSLELAEGEKRLLRVQDFAVVQADVPPVARAFLACVPFMKQRYKDAGSETRLLPELR